jgi:cyclic-di-GMP phosphodiesterase, flagellum assembly factor TipF
MVRISAIFIAVCMVLIAASVSFVVYLRFGMTGAESVLLGLGVLTALAVYNAVAARTRDRTEMSNQIANLARGSADLARQVAEYGRKLNTLEGRVEDVFDKALASAQPLATEIEELSTLVKRLADSVAAHDVAMAKLAATATATSVHAPAPSAAYAPPPPPAVTAPLAAAEPAAQAAPAPAFAAAPAAEPVAAEPPRKVVAAFSGLDKDGIIAAIGSAIEAHRIDLFLQPIVTLPQRKVRYYEAMSRLKAGNGDLVVAGDFLGFAEAGSLVPKLDNLSVLRCVQVVRRLLLKNRDIGLFCNLSGATLTDAGFPELLEFVEANRAIAPSLVFEFTQSAVRAMGPIEHESLAALAERGFRFSMDNLTDLRVEPREMTERGFRFVKAPATLLLNRVGVSSSDIHPADFSDLLGRFGIDLIAERIESENTVVDLLDYDVRFGQGFLFSPPRPVRAEALQGLAGELAAKADPAEAGRRSGLSSAAAPASETGVRNVLAQFARAGSART